jgi:hypothetical protein
MLQETCWRLPWVGGCRLLPQELSRCGDVSGVWLSPQAPCLMLWMFTGYALPSQQGGPKLTPGLLADVRQGACGPGTDTAFLMGSFTTPPTSMSHRLLGMPSKLPFHSPSAGLLTSSLTMEPSGNSAAQHRGVVMNAVIPSVPTKHGHAVTVAEALPLQSTMHVTHRHLHTVPAGAAQSGGGHAGPGATPLTG